MQPPDWAAQRAALRAQVFAGARFVNDVLARKRRGAAALAEIYAGTLAGADVAALARRFVASPWFARFGEVPDRNDQLCIEDAFYRFLCDERVGDPDVRLAEMLDAMIRALAVQPSPAFCIPDEIERIPGGYLAVASFGGRRVAFAAVGSRVLRGPADAVLAQL